MKTTDLKPREIAICKAAHTAMMTNLRAGLVYDVVKLAWVPPEDLTIKPRAERSPAMTYQTKHEAEAPGGYGKDPPTARILRRLAAKAKRSKPSTD
jgi:hypothetical protein